jgi:hypothetical protein
LNSDHYKTWKMSSSQSNVIQIIESKTELRANERICWRIHLTSYAIGLETEDTCSYVIDIVSPTSNYGVAINFFARNSSSS